jgi:hypothetical protein
MLRFLACPAMLCCLAPWLLPREASATALARRTDPKEVDRLLLLMSDPRFPVRTQALIGLEKLGPSILPQLRAALPKTTDPEVRRQLEAVIPKLEQKIALEPTRITLDLKDVTLTKAAQALGTASGYKLEIYRNGGTDPDQQLVSLNLKNVTFWEAVSKLCEAGSYTLQEHYGPDTRVIRLMPGDHYPGTLHLSGAFRVMIRNFYHYRQLDFNNGRNGGAPELRRNDNLSIHFAISAEPKMPLLGAGQAVITEALDDQGQSLRPPPQGRQPIQMHGYRSYMHPVQAQLGVSANGKRLKTLKGTIPVTVVASQRPLITVENLADVKNKTFKEGTTTIHIESVSHAGSQTHIRMNVTESSRAGTHDYIWLQTLQQRLEVMDEKGNKLQNQGGNWNGGMNNLSGTFSFGSNGNGTGKGVKMILYDWATVTHNVPFEFEDIPLP